MEDVQTFLTGKKPEQNKPTEEKHEEGILDKIETFFTGENKNESKQKEGK